MQRVAEETAPSSSVRSAAPPLRSGWRRRGRNLAALTLLAAVAALSGCSDDGGSSSQGNRASIVIKNFKFRPTSVTVSPGSRVTVANHDAVTHTLTATNKSFDTGNIAAHRTATFKAPSKSGSKRFMCAIHPYMRGTLKVS
jgi:plastocyanin